MIHLLLATLAVSAVTGKGHFTFHGSYVEACNCSAPCLCELSGPEKGCQGVGAFQIDHATFNGADLSGVRTAYALGAGQWVVIYIDGPASKRAAAEGFMRDALAGFGPIAGVKNAKVSIHGSGGNFVATVDGGRVMKFSTKPMVGGDGVHALSYANIHDKVHPTVMGGLVTSGTYKDGDKTFTLKDSNAFFNDHIHSSGSF
jgi:hypothetical protein